MVTQDHRQIPSLTDVPGLGRATALGAIVGFLVVGVPFAIAIALEGGPSAETLVGALQVGSFGGIGFGAMLGAVVHAVRHEERERDRRTPDR